MMTQFKTACPECAGAVSLVECEVCQGHGNLIYSYSVEDCGRCLAKGGYWKCEQCRQSWNERPQGDVIP